MKAASRAADFASDLGLTFRPQRGPWLMVGIAVIVGLASGLLAVGLRTGVHSFYALLEPLRHGIGAVLLPAAGAFIGVWVVRRGFREPGGHGVEAVLESVSTKGGQMRRRSMISRAIGSLINVASGGSAGLEGPIVFSAAAVGSNLGRPFRLAERQTVLLLACGVAGGIGAIFDAPLTGLIFAAEVVLAEWSVAAVVPLAVSATVATELAHNLLGSKAAFTDASQGFHPADLAACSLLGILAGLMSVALVVSVRLVEEGAERLREKPGWNRLGVVAAACGLGVGLIGWWNQAAVGEGYDTVSRFLDPNMPEVGLWFLLFLLVAKVFATSLTLGSGAPGGIFAPSLVTGALLGGLYGRLLNSVFPALELNDPSFYALVAMAGLVAGALKAPLTGIFLVLEITGGWELTLPLMVVAVLSVMVSRGFQKYSFYTYHLAMRGKLRRLGTDRRILAEMLVGEILDRESPTMDAGKTLEDLRAVLPTTRRNHFAVVEPGTGRLLGVLDVASLRPFIFDQILRKITAVETVMDTQLPVLAHDETLDKALERFDRSRAWVLPVVKDGRFVGMISKSTLFERYRQELIVQTAMRD